MAGESKGTETTSLGAERGSRDGWRWREIAVAQPGSSKVGGRG
jgi:hypothetical protein